MTMKKTFYVVLFIVGTIILLQTIGLFWTHREQTVLDNWHMLQR